MYSFTKRYVHDIAVRESTRHAFIRQGPPGRSSVSGHVATVFGCTGFLGRYVVNNLAKEGTQVVTPYRGTDDDRRHLKVMGDLGQIVPLRFHLRNDEQIVECIKHSDVVYNLIGRDGETKNFNFDQVHVDGAAKIARLCKEVGVSKFVHVSALNADENSSSGFLRSKALGEKAVKENYPNAIIVRPGTMYGSEDRFYNRMYWFAKFGFLPVVGNGKTTLNPVYVGDVAKALSQILEREDLAGTTVELYGLFGKMIDAIQMQPILTADEVERLSIDDKLSTENVLTFKDFGMEAATLESTVARFIKLYIPPEYQHLPFEKYLKIYQKQQS